MLVIVLAQAGIPEAGLALIFAIDRPLDMCRTIVNVTGDAAVSMIVGKIQLVNGSDYIFYKMVYKIYEKNVFRTGHYHIFQINYIYF